MRMLWPCPALVRCWSLAVASGPGSAPNATPSPDAGVHDRHGCDRHRRTVRDRSSVADGRNQGMLSKGGLNLVIAAVLLGACASSTGAAPSPTPSGAQRETLKVGGQERNYYVLRPTNRKERLPLVLALHGYTQPPQGLEFESKLDDEAAAAGFVVVYPEGIGRSWNASDSGGDAHLQNVDDVGFIRQLIDLMVSTAQIDPKRVFVTGISSGGEMSHRLACELSDRVAAVASVSGDLGIAACNPARPVSVLEIHGTADPFVPIEGDPSQNLPPTMSTMRRWAQIDGCASDSTVNESGITKTTTWGGCRSGTTVVLVAITGADHTFWLEHNPGQPDINKLIWDFFSHALPRS
jgi:polyhydroxybutyrate depolymerase